MSIEDIVESVALCVLLLLRLEDPSIELSLECGISGSDSMSGLSAELDDGEIACKAGVKLDAESIFSTFDTVNCFFVKSSNHFITGQNFLVGPDTAGAPLPHLTSYIHLFDINVSLKLVHAFEASVPRDEH